jgi:hypothetical protein
MCKNKITRLSQNWIREIVNLSVHGSWSVAHHAQSLSPLQAPHLVLCVTLISYVFFSVLSSSSTLSCCGYCAGGGDEQALYYLSEFAQEVQLCYN